MFKKLKAATIMTFDSVAMLAVALAVWLPCFFMYSFDTANPYYITMTLLYGTAYFLIVRGLLALILLCKVITDGNDE